MDDSMKIMVSKIKSWDFKQRLEEIEERLKVLDDYGNETPFEVGEAIREVNQIISYWKSHMKSKDERPKKKRTKPVNLW